ncbi:DUF2793 domain-containing protein [Jannaschia sp. 2305UL9-9]|uniref:DUF2793 domain-containing protein n=1 Tax=Jannaschia sp. 2305UL9-9 TaxID=3121638 RepID=UPI00352707C5
MAQSTPILDLPLIQASQAQKHVTHNEALVALDALVQPVVADLDRTEPPQTPAEGDRHVVAAGPTGAWAGQGGAIAAFLGGGWVFHRPAAGWRTHVLSVGADAVFDGTTWQVAVGSGPQTTLGLNATADATNRLAVAADATLLTHDGAGHRVKINKSAATDTNSLLFQTGFSGRAEMGCAGDDAFSVKVSTDGAAWTQALRFDPATGTASGAAVQQAPDDATPGRLMRADWGYGPATLLAPVSMTAGVPTGGVMERGENANGTWTKLADGTLICTGLLTLAGGSSARVGAVWTFPVPFIAPGPTGLSSHLDMDSVDDDCTPSITSLGVLTHTAMSATSVEIRQYRVLGMTDFAPADQARCRVMAIGRWA